MQTHLSDYNNFGPRFGVTWSPGKNGKTTIRGSVGVFYDWLSTGVYQQTLQVDGVRQRELTVTDPPYPINDVTGAGIAAPTSKYLLTDGLQMAHSTRVSAGVSRSITQLVQINALYQHVVGQDLLRGNARVGAADPEYLGGLADQLAFKKVGILEQLLLSPGTVALQ